MGNRIHIICPFCNASNDVLQLEAEDNIVVGTCHSCKAKLDIVLTVVASSEEGSVLSSTDEDVMDRIYDISPKYGESHG